MEDPSPPISTALLDRVREGDEAASDQLVRALYPLVRSTVRRHVLLAADHDDVTQEIFMKVFLKIDQYRGPRPFEHWVSRLAVTSCHDWLRRRRARPLTSYSDLSERESEFITQTLSGHLDGDPEIRREIFTGLLDKLIGHLKPREQIVIRLLDLEEKSIREAAEATGWSASKIKTIAMRARRKLAERLRRLEGNA